MKKILSFVILGALAANFTACKKALDINENPNQATSSTPAVTLPAGLVGSASVQNNFSQSTGYPGGFFANVYGFGGYGATVSANYGTSDFAGPFQAAYDNLEDYQYILNQPADPTLAYYTGISRIMKAYIFEKLVDNYNDVPYTEALKGLGNLTPKYDKAADIYTDLVNQLNTAITEINAGQALPVETPAQTVSSASDPVFKGSGNINQWKVFANTLKLKMLVKMAQVPETQAFANTQLASWDASLGIIAKDVLVNPGYIKQGGRLAPVYNSLAADENNTRRVTSVLPTKFALGFYNGVKLSDAARATVTYRGGTGVQSNQLGQENLASSVIPPAGSTAFYLGTDFNTPGLGAVKGPAQGQPLMILAEALFIKAEAEARGLIPGSAGAAKTDFEAGIKASYGYLYQDQNGTVAPAQQTLLDASVATYKANNPTSPLVNFELATGLAAQIEAIITQKYIALNLIDMNEAFAEYRRTHFPKTVNGTGSTPETNMASIQSRSTSADKLIRRFPYPQSEYNVNTGNVPQNVNIFTAKIFWDLNN